MHEEEEEEDDDDDDDNWMAALMDGCMDVFVLCFSVLIYSAIAQGDGCGFGGEPGALGSDTAWVVRLWSIGRFRNARSFSINRFRATDRVQP